MSKRWPASRAPITRGSRESSGDASSLQARCALESAGVALLTLAMTFGATAGCRGHGDAASAPAATAADSAGDEAAADMVVHHRHHHHGGVLMLVAMSADDLGLPPDRQARVEQIQSDLLVKMRPARLAEQRVTSLLADGVERSKIDVRAVDDAVGDVRRTSSAAHESALEDLRQLHAALTPSERAALVDKVRAQWGLWKRGNADDASYVSELAKELALRPEQVDKVRAQLGAARGSAPLREAEIEHHLDQLESAFPSDGFDPASLASAREANGEMAAWGTGRLVRFCEAVNPVLTSEQRSKLVGLLREHMGHHEAGSEG